MSKTNGIPGRNRDDDLTKYSLLEIVAHVIGNELAAISGYTQILQRAISTEAQEAFSPEGEKGQQRCERYLSYVQTMRQSEMLLNNFLTQLRSLSQEATKDRFTQCVVRTDLMLLLKRTIERLAPLHRDRTIQAHLSVQPLSILCDPLWMELVLEHVIDHAVEVHTLATPVDIRIKQYEDSSLLLREARIEIRIKSDLLRQRSETEEQSETWSLTLNLRELDVCVALCRAVLNEHGGRLWYELEAEQEDIVILALPLVE